MTINIMLRSIFIWYELIIIRIRQNLGHYGCLNIFAIICDIYGDVWKVRQTNVTNPPENGGGVDIPGNNPVRFPAKYLTHC